MSAPTERPTAHAGTAASTNPGIGYLPGLDGIRALAVVSVIVYHIGKAYRGGWQNWLSGGFLGVEVFFVISGYLITTLLLAEHQRTARIDLRQFWIRRARRLLPALYLLLGGSVLFLWLAEPGELSELGGDLVAAVGYVTNWFLIADGRSYFEVTTLFPIEHLWSLAIEEQWYLVWPIAFWLGLRATRGRPLILVPVLVGLALASSFLMHTGYSVNGASTVYWGTHTRASGLLLGAALALVWRPGRMPSFRGAELGVDLVGAGAFVGLIAYQRAVNEFDVSLWRWSGPRPSGFVLVDVLTLILIAAAVHPKARGLSRLLGAAPLRWIGTRSYGLYLWHWPVLVLLGPRTGFDVTNRTLLLVVQLLTVVAVTEASYRFVETPIRHGAIGRILTRAHAARGEDRERYLVALSGAAVAIIGAVGLVAAAVSTADPLVDPNRLSATSVLGETATALAGGAAAPPVAGTGPAATPTPTTSSSTTESTPTKAPEVTEPTAGADGATPATETQTESPTAPATVAAGPPFSPPIPLTVVGDSVGMMMVINFPASVGGSVVPVNGTIEGCGMVDTATMNSSAPFRRDLRGDCAGFETRWAQSASANAAAITLVVLGAWEVFDMETDDGMLAFGSPEHDALLRAGLDRSVAALLATGTQVVFLNMPCFNPVDGGGLIALPERGDRSRTEHMNELFVEQVAAHPGRVFSVEPPPEFCDDPVVAADLNLRWDGVHYGPPGGELIWRYLEPQLLAIPQPIPT